MGEAESAREFVNLAEILQKADSYTEGKAGTNQPLARGSDVEIAQRIVEKLREAYGGNVVYCDGDFYGYDGKRWEALEEHEMRRYVHIWDGAVIVGKKEVGLNRSRIDSILKESATILMVKDWFVGERFGINCANGLVEFGVDGTPRLVDHEPAHRKRHVLNAEWNGPLSIKGSKLERLLTLPFLGDPEAEDKIKVIGEAGGSAATGLATKLVSPKAIVFEGEAANNGKSQILELCRGVLPERAVASISPMKFDDDKYRVMLAGKMLNTSDELGTAHAISGEIFKFVVTGNPLSARNVYERMLTFRSRAQHMFACNELPSVQGGMDPGVLRRLLVLLFGRVIPEEDRIPNFASMVLREEMPLVLSFVVDGASRLLRQGKFTEPGSSRGALERWANLADTVLGWLDERVVRSDNDNLQSTVAYVDYSKWTIAGGRKPYSQKVFSQKMQAAGYKPDKSGAWRGFRGIKLVSMEDRIRDDI